jgi:hypothetical protein
LDGKLSVRMSVETAVLLGMRRIGDLIRVLAEVEE